MKKSTFLILLVLLALNTVSAQVSSLTGSGTAVDPWKIGTVDELKFLRDQINQSTDGTNLSDYQTAGKYFELTANIDLTGENWVPIGILTQDYASFRGYFDGAGFKISNLNVGTSSSRLASNQAGLFGELRSGAVIRNLTIENATIYSAVTNNGILTARAFGVVLIENVKILDATIDVLVNNIGINAGGITGVTRDAVIINSSTSNVNITTESKNNSTAKEQCIGNIAGRALAATAAPGSRIINCSANGGSIISKATDNDKSYFAVGGILGRSAPNANANLNYVINCYTNTALQLEYYTTTITGAKNIGGVVGTAENNFQVANSIANNSGITQSDGALLLRGRIIGSLVGTATASDNYASAINFTPAYDYSATIGAATKEGADLGTNNPNTLLDTYVASNPTYTFPSTNYSNIAVNLKSWADVSTNLKRNNQNNDFVVSRISEGVFKINSNAVKFPAKVNIYSMDGRLSQTVELQANDASLQLNLNKGIYIIKLRDSENTFIQKVQLD